MLHIKKGKKYRLTKKQQLWPYTHPWSDIDIVQISLFFIELSIEKIVNMLLTMICMIPKVNLEVGEMGFMFCDLYVSLK